ncbi:acyl-CoA dehydrogenase family protein [Parahaliea aestuarii]|uniref:Acyl-CoA dehydrogenase n=1 Tax=Parahaliea aestuarii TaxID=1852021 RepID=A0A5C8ZQS0_9GAMM|nr:acyl-CoA dehydrogenase family protein [Parahaliea aestuarii]TXS90079.1 acyl-CoA dehydrogenase [Parahaliea aestuarii]
MEFAFTEEQQMIRDTAADFLAEVSTSEAVRAAMNTEAGYDAALWDRVCQEMFWQAIHIPEEHGGMGLGYVELVAMLEQMGRYLFCSPFFSTVCLGVNALRIAGNEAQQAQYLPEIVAGKTATLAYASANGGWDSDAITATCTAEGAGYRLDGTYRYVSDGHTADILIVAARKSGSAGDDGVSLFVLDADTVGVSRKWLPTMDQTRKQAEVVLNGVVVGAEALMGEAGKAWPQLQQVLDLARVAIAADQVGGAQQSLDITVDYLQERVQFGRVIASYQAVKHKAADMMVKVEAGRSALYYAACVADEALSGGALGAELAEAASVAKAWCSEAYFFNAGCGIQLFGGVGFTAEYDIQLYFKRAKSTETFLGDAAYHRERLAQQILDGEAAA